MGMPVTGAEKVAVIRAEGQALSELERRYGVSQADVADELIERTCFGGSVCFDAVRGGRCTDCERLNKVRAALDMHGYENNPAPTGTPSRPVADH